MRVIGIVCRLETLEEQQKWFVNASYVQAFAQYDCTLFPILSYASLNLATSLCDALVLPGGYDVHGYYLGEIPDDSCMFYDSAQDHFDFSCITAFLDKQKPILGICRGMQMLALYFGSTLLQNFDVTLHATKQQHALHIPKGSILQQLFANGSIVNSYHHQAVAHVASCLEVLATSEDERIEAFQHKYLPILGIQWHPEKLANDQILPYFLDIVCARSLRRL